MFEQINADLKEALKSGDKFKLSVLRMMKSALQLETINNKVEATDEVVTTVLKRQVKQRMESIKEYTGLGKNETAADLQKEVEIINAYLPAEASMEEIQKTIDEAFLELKPSSIKDMGNIMKYVASKLKNADMTKVSNIVREKLNN